MRASAGLVAFQKEHSLHLRCEPKWWGSGDSLQKSPPDKKWNANVSTCCINLKKLTELASRRKDRGLCLQVLWERELL